MPLGFIQSPWIKGRAERKQQFPPHDFFAGCDVKPVGQTIDAMILI